MCDENTTSHFRMFYVTKYSQNPEHQDPACILHLSVTGVVNEKESYNKQFNILISHML